ncbi:MAG: hypothetical protein PHY47_23625 [Lachnospiraceae bacterium]|nr:hypothetical protein [Lachnospiraceae bacterium]
MELVYDYGEIKRNLSTIDTYLEKKTDPEYTYDIDLIKRGTCIKKKSTT